MNFAGGLLLLIAGAALVTDDGKPALRDTQLPALAREPTGFVPAGWRSVAIKIGDLNGDRKADAVVLMRMTDPANIRPAESKYYKQDDTNPYFLAVGFAGANGYGLAASNSALFPRETAPMHGDDPPGPDSFTISNGVLTLEFGHLRGFDRYRFRWNGKAFALIGFDCAGVAGDMLYGLSANYVTGRARIERSNISDQRPHYRTVRVRSGQRPTLEQAEWGDGWIGQDRSGNELSC